MVTYSTKRERLSGEDRRRQLIEVAIDLFSRKGFGGTTTKEIAAAAGVNEAIIFRHFATKQDLYGAILDHKIKDPDLQAGFASFCTLLEKQDDKAVFGWLVKMIFKIFREDARFERLMLFAALEGHEIAVMHQALVNPFFNALQNYILKRQKAGALIACDPQIVICAAVGMAKQYAMSKYIFGWKHSLKSDDDDVAEGLTGVVVRGLKGRKKL